MKIRSLIALIAIWLSSCVGTDLVEDRLSSMTLSAAEEEETINGSLARLVGESITLEAWGMSDLGGSFQMIGVTWSSSAPAVAMVNEEGTVTALSAGTAMITASAQGVDSDPVTISVASDLNTVALIQIVTENNLSVINPGETLQLSGSTLNAAGDEIQGNTINWSSSNEEVATVDETGLVTGIADGAVRISANAAGVTGFVDLYIGDASSLSKVGQFEGLGGYRTSGDVTLMVNDDGSVSMILGDNFSAQDGPGLYFYLSNSRSSVSGGVELGPVRTLSGADTYEVPDGVGLFTYNHVVLYCKPFGVGFGTAQLEN